MTSIPLVKLNNGAEIPQLGLGTARNGDEDTRRVVAQAIGLGYRLIDTAAKYENERGVGQGIADSGVAREDLFITSKLRGADQGYDSARRAVDASLDRLGLDYLDLYLIHWPLPRLDLYVDSWRALEEAVAQGRIRTIGVSNFLPGHLDRLAAETTTVPAVNQIEIHPQLPQREFVADNTRRGILTQSWSPLANANDLLKSPVLSEIAQAHGCSEVQVVLAWHLRQGLLVIPKASHPDRLRQNLDVFGIALTDDDVTRIATLETGERVGGQDPATHEEF